MSTADSLSYAFAGVALATGAAAVVIDSRRRRSMSADGDLARQPSGQAESENVVNTTALSVALAHTDRSLVWRITSECDARLTVDIFSYRDADADDDADRWHHELMDRSIYLPPRHRHLWPAAPAHQRSLVAIGWTLSAGKTGALLTLVEHPS